MLGPSILFAGTPVAFTRSARAAREAPDRLPAVTALVLSTLAGILVAGILVLGATSLV
jgi:hypothetical protein